MDTPVPTPRMITLFQAMFAHEETLWSHHRLRDQGQYIARLVAEARVLGGILHPGGQQWNRYNVQLGLVDEAAAEKVPGGSEVLRRSALLRAKVRGALALRVA